MGHCGHLIVGHNCRFHLSTYLGNGYLVSTVGEYWPERAVREIHAEVHDPQWLAANRQLRGDYFDAAYMEHFGFEQIGMDRLYETMVFKAKKSDECGACPYTMTDAHNLDFGGYNDPKDALEGHYLMCEKWSKKKSVMKEAA